MRFFSNKLLLIASFWLACLQLPAQNYTPFKDDEALLSNWKKITAERLVKDSLSVTGEHKKKIQKEFRERFNGISELFTEKEAVSEKVAHDYIQAIAKQILENNPQLQPLQPRIYLSRSAVPNAYSCGEGSIFFNAGLLYQLKNESQLAFILCHELAHYYLDHGNSRIINNVNTLNSNELKSEIKKISKSLYEQNKKIGELITSMIFKNSRYTRMQETAADSLGFVFFNNTRFDIGDALTTMDVLDSTDVEKVNMEALMKKWFNFPEYPFKESWLKKESAFFGGPVSSLTAAQKDSLKTHPDCQFRKKTLENYVLKSAKKGVGFVVNEQQFNLLSKRSRYDLVESLLRNESISGCLYFALQLLEENPTDPWLIGTVGECLNQLYLHQKDHTLGKVASLPNPLGMKEYNVLLEFIQRARLDDFAALSHFFLQKNSLIADNERYKNAMETSNKIFK